MLGGSVLAVLLLTLAVAALASAQVGPKDLEEARETVAGYLSIVDDAYEATACHYFGGSIIFRPPGAGDAGLAGCDDPWCNAWAIASVMCFERERILNPDPQHSGICVVYQTVTPESVVVPFQDAMGPVRLRCLDPLMHNSVYGGTCAYVVQVSCMQEEDGFLVRFCAVYSTTVGCSDVMTGECTQDIQTFCIGYYYPIDDSPRVRMVCVLWVEAINGCASVSDPVPE